MLLASGWFGARPTLASAQLLSAADLGFFGLAHLPGDPPLRTEGLILTRQELGWGVAASTLLPPPDSLLDLPAWSASDPKIAHLGLGAALAQRPFLQEMGSDLVLLDPGCGEGDGAERGRRLLARMQAGDAQEGDEALESLAPLGREVGDAQLENLCRSLHGILSELSGIGCALAPSANPASLLTPQTFRTICAELPRAKLGLWYDVGAVEARAWLGLEPVGDWLEVAPSSLAGASLQDFALGRDRLAPGEGTVDFALIREYLPREALRVLAMAPAYPGEALQEAQRALEAQGLQ